MGNKPLTELLNGFQTGTIYFDCRLVNNAYFDWLNAHYLKKVLEGVWENSKATCKPSLTYGLSSYKRLSSPKRHFLFPN